MPETDPCPVACIIVREEVNAIIRSGAPKIAGAMPGKPRKDEPSVQLTRLRWMFLQLIREGHPDWKDENGYQLTNVSQAEVARRTGLTATYVNAILNPETRRNMDIGASILAQVSDRVGLDVRYFYDGYTGERPHKVYYLAHKREQKQADADVRAIIKAAVSDEVSRLRSETVAMYSGLRVDVDSTKAAYEAAETELASLRQRLAAVQRERDEAVTELAARKRIVKSRR